MSNNTSLTIQEAGSLILSQPYLLWLEKDVFPFIFGTTCLLIILTGTIFNIATLKMFWNDDHVGIRRTVHLCVFVDVLAVMFVLAPGMYISFSKLDDIPIVYCRINGVFILSTTLIQFGILSYGLVLSFIALLQGTFKTEFHTRCKHVCSFVGISVFYFSVALIPIYWNDGYSYLASEYLCGPNRSLQKAYINVTFVIGLMPPFFLTFVVSFALIKKLLLKNKRVSEIPHSGSKGAILEEDQTSSHEKSQVSIGTRNRFKSDETVSIEDQTRSYDIHEDDDVQSKRNRFKSDVTVSIEDHTRSYNNAHFKNSFKSGITISMEDKTRSFDTSVRCQESEFASLEKRKDELEYCFRKTSSTGSSIPSPHGFLDDDDIGAFDSVKVYSNETDSDSDSDDIPFGKPAGDSITKNSILHNNNADSDAKICINEPHGSRHATPVESKQKSLHGMITDGNGGNSKDNNSSENRTLPIIKLLRSTRMDDNVTVKFVTTNIIVSFVVITCWIPFVIMVYIDMYGDTWWSGWLTLAVLFANISYCIKPLMILGIRGQLVNASKAVLPKSVGDKADRLTSVVTTTFDKLSKRIT
jgi:hypothetical protein